MVERVSFEYAVLRVVPRIERGEAINAGVIVYCQAHDFLASRVQLDRQRLAAIDAAANADDVVRALDAAAACEPAGADSIGQRFRWLTAPRSTVVQPGAIHTGLTTDPERDLQRLFATLVLPSA